MQIVHLTSVHPRHDSRIFVKQVKTLALEFGPVCLMVADGKGPAQDGDVRIVDLGQVKGGRIKRFFAGSWRAFFALRKMDAQIVHFHDPELIFLGVVLRLSGVKVIYDVHEDLPRQILDKPYLAPFLRRPAAFLASVAEWVAGKVMGGIVAATPVIGERFPVKKTIVVHNFPILDEFKKVQVQNYAQRDSRFAYVGGMVVARGAKEMVGAIGKCPDGHARLVIAGAFPDLNLRRTLEARADWERVEFVGWLDRQGISELLAGVRAGLVVLHPTPSYVVSFPIKMFEYMASGLPVIASDFVFWQTIIEEAQCGILVNPLDEEAIAHAMDWILTHPQEAQMMGARGRAAVEEKYNWETEGKKLLAFYRRLGAMPIDEDK